MVCSIALIILGIIIWQAAKWDHSTPPIPVTIVFYPPPARTCLESWEEQEEADREFSAVAPHRGMVTLVIQTDQACFCKVASNILGKWKEGIVSGMI